MNYQNNQTNTTSINNQKGNNMNNTEGQGLELYAEPKSKEEFFLLHKDCDICVPFFKVLNIFYKPLLSDPETELQEIDRPATLLTPYLYAYIFTDLTHRTSNEFSPLIKAQFDHLCWLHQ